MLIPSRVLDLDVFLGFDYKANEIRFLAETTQDPLLIAQLNNKDIDIHCQVGHALTGWPVEKVAKDRQTRKLVKNIHFGLIYGLTKQSLPAYLIAKGVRAKKSLSDRYYDRYFQKYRGVKKWIDWIRDFVEENDYAENIFGFRRPIKSSGDTSGRKTFYLNQAVNSPIQGGAHQMLLIALANLHLKPKTYHLLQRPVMEVHDALYFFTKLRHLVEAYKQGMDLLERSTVEYVHRYFKRKLSVPFVAEAKAGFCLGSLVEYTGAPINKFLAEWRQHHAEVEKAAWEALLPK